MKTITTLIFLFATTMIMAQEKNEIRVPLIGESAPQFVAQSTNGKINFPADYFGKWKILFSHPAAFTPVCTSELLELAYMQERFSELNTEVIVVSTDGINSHIEWVKSMESITYKDRTTPKIKFPLVSDTDLNVSRKYGMLHPYSSTTKDIRGVFIINPENKISAIFFYPNSTGRNLEEIERTLIALQSAEKYSAYTPANWIKGEDLIFPSPLTREDADKLVAKNDPDMYSYAWYFWFVRKK